MAKNSSGIDFGLCYNDLTGGKIWFLYYRTRAGRCKLKVVHQYADGTEKIQKAQNIKDVDYMRAYREYIMT